MQNINIFNKFNFHYLFLKTFMNHFSKINLFIIFFNHFFLDLFSKIYIFNKFQFQFLFQNNKSQSLSVKTIFEIFFFIKKNKKK